MSIEKNILTHEEIPFTIILNETIQNIRHIGAAGIYSYLSSKPAGWNICKKHLQNHFNCGRDYINTCFKYLKEIGLIDVKMTRNEKGQSQSWETILRRKIPYQILTNIHITENPYSGDLSTPNSQGNIQNTEKPHSGQSAPINKEQKQNKEVIKKTRSVNRSVIVTVPFFSCSQDLKTHLLMILKNKNIILDEEITEQILWYIAKETEFDKINKKINIALKLIRESKWKIPHGFNGITSQSMKLQEEKQNREKEDQIHHDANIGYAIAQAVKKNTTYTSLAKRLQELAKDKNANEIRLQKDVKPNRI